MPANEGEVRLLIFAEKQADGYHAWCPQVSTNIHIPPVVHRDLSEAETLLRQAAEKFMQAASDAGEWDWLCNELVKRQHMIRDRFGAPRMGIMGHISFKRE